MTDDAAPAPGYPAERVKAFADAVVAIAMTLLILPLLDSVGEVARDGGDSLDWLSLEWGSILLFLTSFAVTAMFWLIHHRLFAKVERVTGPLLWLLMAWLVTIVWLPVATAATGAFDVDALQLTLYIGSMMLTSAVTIGIRSYLRAHPALRTSTDAELRTGIAVDLSMLTLFAAALAIAIAVPAINYFALTLLTLTSVVERPYARLLGVPAGR